MNTNKKLSAAVAALVGLGAVAFSIAAARPAAAQTPPFAGRERHPELRRALRTLERTESDLRHSARDFDGHREKAADLCHQAEGQIQLALRADRG